MCTFLSSFFVILVSNFFLGGNSPTLALAVSLFSFLDHTQLEKHIPQGLLRTSDQPVSEITTYSTHNKHNRRTSISSAGFEPAIPASKRFHTYVLEGTATGIVFCLITNIFPDNSKWSNIKKLEWIYVTQKEFRTELVKPTCPCVHFFVFLETIIIIIIVTIIIKAIMRPMCSYVSCRHRNFNWGIAECYLNTRIKTLPFDITM